ncbi:MAG TPA: lipid II flippase MurJ, partial [Trichormus sp.]
MQANSAPPGKQPEAQPTKSTSPSLGKTFSLVGILTTFSKFLGFARDIVIFHAYGAGVITDAYNYASLLTANILILFGGLGGPFHQSTVAVIEPRKDDSDVGKLIFQLVLNTAIVLSVITVVFLAGSFLLAPALSFFPALNNENGLWTNTAVQLRIMLPLILISGVIGILYGISNVYGEFKWPSLSPAIASVAMIAAVLIYPDQAGWCLAIGTLVGGVLQLLAQLPATLPHMRWQLSFKPEPGAKEYTAMLWPATLSTSIGTLTVYVDALFVSSIKLGPAYHGGAWTAIVNSNRLVQLPLGILLTAMIVPILPRFTQQVAEKRIDDLKTEFHKGLRILWFLSLPISALLIAIPYPILQLLYQRGA